MSTSEKLFERLLSESTNIAEVLMAIDQSASDGIITQSDGAHTAQTLRIVALGTYEGKIFPQFATRKFGFRNKLLELQKKTWDGEYRGCKGEVVEIGGIHYFYERTSYPHSFICLEKEVNKSNTPENLIKVIERINGLYGGGGETFYTSLFLRVAIDAVVYQEYSPRLLTRKAGLHQKIRNLLEQEEKIPGNRFVKENNLLGDSYQVDEYSSGRGFVIDVTPVDYGLSE